jgi:hypothetical protein
LATVILTVPSAAIADVGTTAVIEVELTYVVVNALLSKLTRLALTKPVPVTVRVCGAEPATRVPGEIETIPGVGFVALPVDGG